jgi:hypothetical protein
MRLILFVSAFLITYCCYSQETVKGIVYDRQGAIAAVIVTELDTDDQNVVYTNSQGEFEIITKTKNPVLKFTFVGYAPKTVKIKKSGFLKVKMKLDLLKVRDLPDTDR